ncbi:MAG: diguanylate cyclase, partial [Pseudomonadales bacterium]|nr:diguanylate cyclase [Pseudomonadales bacterium]
WIGTNNGGLAHYDQAADTFVSWQHDPQDPESLSSNDIRIVFLDSSNQLWIGTKGGGLNRRRLNQEGFEKFRADPADPHSLPSDSITDIFEDDDGIIWIGTEGGLARFDSANSAFDVWQHDPRNEDSLSDNFVRKIIRFDDDLWVGTNNGGITRFDDSMTVIRRYQPEAGNPRSLPHGLVRDLEVDHEGTLWAGTDGGVAEWQPNSDDFVTYTHNAEDLKSLSTNRVETIYLDRSNVLWIGTYEGLNRWNYLSSAFSYYTVQDGDLKNDAVHGLTESPDGTVWVGTYGGGLDRLVPDGKGNYKPQPYKISLPDDRVMSLWAEDNNNLWIGSRSGGLCHLQVQEQLLNCATHDPDNPDSPSVNGITAVWGDDSYLWVSTYGGGLNRIERASGRYRHYRFDENNPRGICSDRILGFLRDSDGQLWFGCETGGMSRYVPETDDFERVAASSDDSGDGLSNNAAWELFESSDKTLWIGTLNGGVNAWKYADRSAGRATFTRYDRTVGLRSNTIYGILEDDSGAIWMSSNRGLAQLNPSTMEIRHYDQHNGTRGDEFNFASRVLSRSGELLFGGNDGLLVLNPDDLMSNTHVPEIVVNGTSSLNKKVSSHSSLTVLPDIELDYTERLITFEFAALDYASPDKNLYQYRLEGFDDDWINADGFRRATYTSLPAGEYVFRVRGSNNDKVWNEKGAGIRLIVVPPPWLSWWAFVIYVFIVGGAIASYIILQRRKLENARRQQQILEELVRQRTQELAEQNEKLELANDQLREASMTDALTGLHNRRYLYDYLENQVALMQRYLVQLGEGEAAHRAIQSETTIFFMMIDLDGFKSINDKYGHPAGDEALIQVCDILLKYTRDSDTVIRWGGDEFLIVGRGHGLSGANQLAERIRKGLMDHEFVVGNGDVGRMTGSIGFAPYPFNTWYPNRFSWEQVIAIADQAAYVSKTSGKNAWMDIEGCESFSMADFTAINDNLQSLVDEAKVNITTSMTREINFNG